MKLHIDKSALRAVVKFASREDVRYYLCGVLLEVGREESRLVATDGHKLAVYRIMGESDVTETRQYIIPLSVIKPIKKPGKRDNVTWVSLDIEGDTVTVRDGDATHMGKLVDGKYPDWRRIVHGLTFSGEVGHYNPDYLSIFADAADELTGARYISLAYNGRGPAGITFKTNTNFFGIIMPMTVHEPVKQAPAWVSLELTTKLEEAA